MEYSRNAAILASLISQGIGRLLGTTMTPVVDLRRQRSQKLGRDQRTVVHVGGEETDHDEVTIRYRRSMRDNTNCLCRET